MNKKRVAVVVPVYKPELTWWERISLKRLWTVLGKYPLYFIIPQGMDISYIHIFPTRKVKSFPREYFADIKGYNRLLLTDGFYQEFSDYEYILIHQLDALVFVDKLEEFCSLGYSYIGAPWYFNYSLVIDGRPIRLHVGNGGFSLRRVESCLWLLEKYTNERDQWTGNEDIFFAYYGRKERDFNRGDVKTACAFACEMNPARIIRKNQGVIPFGCHGWHRYGKDFYLSLPLEIKCLYRTHAELMQNRDTTELKKILHGIAKFRLLRRIKNGEGVGQYLAGYPQFVWGGNVYTLTDADRLLFMALKQEGYFIDACTVVSVEECVGKKVVVIVMDDDDEINEKFQFYGMRYGLDYISFWREYIGCLCSIMGKSQVSENESKGNMLYNSSK